MSTQSNSSQPGIGRYANGSLKPSLTTHGWSVSHGATTASSQPASLSSDGDHGSMSSQTIRKRDKQFQSTTLKEDATIQDDPFDTIIRHSQVSRIASAVSGLKVSSFGTESQPTASKNETRLIMFLENASRTSTRITLPKLDLRIDSTSQLALCISLLQKDVTSSLRPESFKWVSNLTNKHSWTTPVDVAEQEWIKAIKQNPVKQEHLRWLGSRIVEEFIKNAVKDPVAVSEVVLLGSVLDQAHYRKLLNCFIEELNKSTLLDVDLLQGLVQLVQCASPTYLESDDLVKILSILRKRLGDTHQHSSEHQYHLTLAVSRLLDVMAEPEHKVRDLPRVEEREPLASVLSGLKTSSDPYLMYQALYAFQAVQYVPDDESAVQAIMRYSLGTTEGLIKISGVVQLNFDGLLEGLKQMQKTAEETYGIVKSSYEGVSSLIDSGRGLCDSLKKGLSSGHKLPWYPAVLSITALCRSGQLKDFSKLVREAPCRRDSRFQWGVSQLLGEIATDLEWKSTIREQAVSFLEDLYLNDADWGIDESVRSWMLAIFRRISEVPEYAVREAAATFLHVRTKIDSTTAMHPYPLRSHLPIPVASPLLALVQDIPYIEYDLDNLRLERLLEFKQTVYIPPQANVNLQAPDNDTLPLMKKVKRFLESDGQVFLVLGDSGAGKSTFNRHLEHELWNEYKPGGRIPLFISLPAVTDSYRDIIGEQFRIHGFSEDKIKELKKKRNMILICDGYDEMQLKVNLHSTNMLNIKGQAATKMIISCRSTYLGQDYRDLFRPQRSDRYSAPAADLYTEAVIVPFSKDQVKNYVYRFVRDPEVHKLIGDRPIWSAENYLDKLRSIPNLMELVKNPFLLSLTLRALPDVVKDGTDVTKIRVTRLTLYDSFINQWLDISRLRLMAVKFATEEKNALQDLLEEGHTVTAIAFLKKLAAAIFREQEGNPVIQYSPLADKGTWKMQFFDSQPLTTLLRECSPLSRAGTQHRFLHRSLLEYFYSRHMYETSDNADVLSNDSYDLAEHPLGQRSLVPEPSVIQFLAEHAKDDCGFRQRLHRMIERSKTDATASQAAANAITILVRAGVLFNGADLTAIKIPGADLSGGQFDSAQLQGADLRNTNLGNTWLRQADFSNAHMEDVRFGEYPYLEEKSRVQSCAYSPDGKALALGLFNCTTSLYNTATWERTHSLNGHTAWIMSVMFSPNGQQIASGSWDKTVRLWNAQTGAPGVILSGHTEGVASVVFSPSGQQIASGSYDCTVRLWDAKTGSPKAIFSGHTDLITSVVFSPSGQQIASGSWDKTVRFWDAQTGATDSILRSHTDGVASVVFSPSGRQIVSGSGDKTVRLWDAQTGVPAVTLSGHIQAVTSVVFSPCGQQIASGSWDKTVRLWDAQTGAPGVILSGHNERVTSVVFSPCGQQIASGSEDTTVRLRDAQVEAHGASGHTDKVTVVAFSPSGQLIASGSRDKSVRLWDAQSGAPGAILKGHTYDVTSVVFSPSGHQIASGSYDGTVRLWDTQTGAPGVILTGHNGVVTSVVFSPSGQQIASGSRDETVRLWNAQTGAPGAILTGHNGVVTSVVFSSSGQQIASGSRDNTVRLWNAQTGAPGAIPGAILTSHNGVVTSVVFSPSGQQIASGSRDETVRLWNAQTGAPGAILTGHNGVVTSVVFSPSGQQIASGSEDNTVRLWDVKYGHCLATIEDVPAAINSIAWNGSTDDSYLATGCDDGSVCVWKVVGISHRVGLLWSSSHDRLVVSGARILSAQGLSGLNIKLIEQHRSGRKPRSVSELSRRLCSW